MPLYQTSVLKNYLKRQDKETVAKAFKKFSKYFHNTSIQQNIRESKEEQFQEGFLRELFVDILGYTLNPQPNYNLTTELKNEKGAKKADGAILLDGNALGVIELKSTKTKDLESIRQQAFDYKANQTGCVYVVTSNFEKLRFYINNAVEFEEFDLFTLTESRFELLYLCLHKDNLLSNVPLKIKEASVREEEVITKKFYNDYSLFKRELFRDLVKLNMKNEVFRAELNREDTERGNKNIKHALFKKSQKLIDRFLFIFFAEDRDLLPPNSTLKILEQWNKLKDLDAYTPLYDRFKLYFGYLDTGRKGTDKGAEIFAYNGGLFKPDPILDSLQISDELLFKHTEALSKYDFESQVDVNILGHIFENSLNEIESVNAEIEGVEFDKQKTKRKKDGVFYTPKYITKYIVDNTVGKLCAEKKAELKIVDEEYTKNRKGRTTAKLKELRDQLDNYRNWLLQITICDTACGSGAFLNQALDFLIKEHQYIDELQTSLLGGGFVFPDIENTVLENNIFGVDLNEESVEIAKLSLWLRTAQPKRKLNDLSSNIKCGNSLIDDPKVAGSKAFKWKNEFPQIFAKGGFDVVIGNPPYGAELNRKDWLKLRYKETSFGNIDSYKYFVQLGTELVVNKGTLGYIMPDSYLEKEYFKDLRIFASNQYKDITNIKMGDNVFEDVNLPTSIIILNKKGQKATQYQFLDLSNTSKINKPNSLVDNSKFILDIPEVENTFISINSIIKTKNTIPLIEVYDQVMGVKTYQKGKGNPKQSNFEKENDVFISNNLDDKFNYPYISQGIYRYSYQSQNEFISYGEWLAEPRKKEYFDNPKIVIREIINPRIYATYIEEPAVVKNIAAVIIQKDKLYPIKFLLGLINSKLFTYYVNEQSPKSSNKSYPSFNSRLLKQLPIVKCDEKSKTTLISKVEYILEKTNESISNNSKFAKYLQSQFSIEKLTTKLQNWHELTFAEFIKELNKVIKTSGGTLLTKLQEMEWMEVFETKKAEAQTLKAEIDKTDKEIDKMVYELYGLTDEEIKIVEDSTK